MSNVLSEQKKNQIIALGRLGWSLRAIEASTGVRRETASKYLREEGVALRAPRHRRTPKPASEAITDSGSGSKPASGVITDLGVSSAPPGPAPGRSTSACEPYREWIEQGLRQGRNAMSLWQELVTDHGFEARYASVQRFVRRLRQSSAPEAHPIIQTPPGEEAQVDYGEGPMVLHPETGKYRRTRLFVMTLGFSRKCVRLLTFKSSSEIWCRLHEESFRRLGGAPKVVVLDNLKEGVLKPDVYDPTLNPLYASMLKHYDVVALPCRVAHPNRKGKVESAIGHTQRTPLKGRRFESLADAQAHLDQWEERWADTRIHGTTKRQVAAMFSDEKPHLKTLPSEPFRYFEYGTRTVHLDGCVEVKGGYYHAGPGWLGRKVHVQWDHAVVRLIDPRTGELLRESLRTGPGRYRIRKDDRPQKTPPETVELVARAGHAGKNIKAVAESILQRDRDLAPRRVLGLLSLVKKYGAAMVDDAAEAALELENPTYRCVRRYLERKPALQLQLKQVDPLIRELTQYRDAINHITKGEES